MIVSNLVPFQGHIIRSYSRVPSLKYKEEAQISEQNNSLPCAKLFFFSCMVNLTERSHFGGCWLSNPSSPSTAGMYWA